MKILLISDSHGDTKTMDYILNSNEHDISIHLGDSELMEHEIRERFDYYVSGNNDFFHIPVREFTINDFRFVIMHGHTEGINIFNYAEKSSQIKEKYSANVLLFGHTHIPFFSNDNSGICLCPGSISSSRKGPETYSIITIDEKEIKAEIIELHNR